MSRTYHHGKDRHIRVRGIRRPTDLRRLARALSSWSINRRRPKRKPKLSITEKQRRSARASARATTQTKRARLEVGGTELVSPALAA